MEQYSYNYFLLYLFSSRRTGTVYEEFILNLFRFASLLSRLEKKPACKGHSLEIFLTYPMHQVQPISFNSQSLSQRLTIQIPRYIITLHELLAHTPPDHVEKNSLENAREKLEDLSRQMHDEVTKILFIRAYFSSLYY